MFSQQKYHASILVFILVVSFSFMISLIDFCNTIIGSILLYCILQYIFSPSLFTILVKLDKEWKSRGHPLFLIASFIQ